MKEIYNHQVIDDLYHFEHCHGNQLQEPREYSISEYKLSECHLNDYEFTIVIME